MNKEIETLINNLEGCIGMFDYLLTPIESNLLSAYIKELQQENKELKEKINTYENPDDLTLMFMYCDEKAKDKIKALQERIEYLERSNNRREETIELERKENLELHNKIDKAIDYIKKYQQIYDIDGSIEKQIDEFNVLASPKKLLEILKDSDVDE